MISEGFFVGGQADVPQIAARRRGGITIYTLNAPAGARSASSCRRQPRPRRAVDARRLVRRGLDVLAAETGGMSIRYTDNFRPGARTDRSTRAHYVLAYSPENATLDGKFRRIELKTKWQGVEIRARRGYVASPLPPPKTIRTGK